MQSHILTRVKESHHVYRDWSHPPVSTRGTEMVVNEALIRFEQQQEYKTDQCRCRGVLSRVEMAKRR